MRVAFNLTQRSAEFAQILGRILLPIEHDTPQTIHESRLSELEAQNRPKENPKSQQPLGNVAFSLNQKSPKELGVF